MKTTPSFGWAGPDSDDCIITNRTGGAVAVGDVLQLDNRRRDATSTSNTLGLNTAGLANGVFSNATVNGVAPVASDLAAGIFCCVQSAAATAFKCKARLKGYVDALNMGAVAVTLATVEQIGPPISGTGLAAIAVVVANSGAAAALARKVIFIPLTAKGAVQGTVDGWFDGVAGFGTVLV
jgi:hypothetical protein